MGWLVLAFLTGTAALAAAGVALRTAPAGRAELGVATSSVFFALLAGPVLALGYTSQLTAPALGASALALHAGTFLASSRGQGVLAHLRRSAGALVTLAASPLHGVREAVQARSLVAIGLLWAGFVGALALVLLTLAHIASVDGFFYHEPIVGYAIQNRGFAMVALPPTATVQGINGFPRLCEAVAIWFVIFTDRTFVELPNLLAMPGCMWCAYALARRYGDRVTAMGWAAVLLLVPALWAQLAKPLVDVQVTFFMLTSLYYATRPELPLRAAALALLGMTLLMGSKGHALASIPPLALILAVRALAGHGRRRPAATIATLLAGGGAVAGLALVTLVRNWVAFDDPVWPLGYDSAALGIHWKGLANLADFTPQPSFKAMLEKTYGVPLRGWDDCIRHGYGYAVPYVVVPFGALGLVAALGVALRRLILREGGSAATNLALVAIPSLLWLRSSPSLDIPRYNMHVLLVLMLACTWLAAGRRAARLREGIVAGAVVLSIVPFVSWINGTFWLMKDQVIDRLLHPLASRAYLEHPNFDMLGRERVEELHSGDRVAYTQDLLFIGAMWNFEFSNRVQYVPFDAPERFLRRITRYDPKWVAVGDPSPAREALEATGRWELVGRVTPGEPVVVLRRRGSRARP